MLHRSLAVSFCSCSSAEEFPHFQKHHFNQSMLFGRTCSDDVVRSSPPQVSLHEVMEVLWEAPPYVCHSPLTTNFTITPVLTYCDRRQANCIMSDNKSIIGFDRAELG